MFHSSFLLDVERQELIKHLVQWEKRQVNKNIYYTAVSAEWEKGDGEYHASQGTGEEEEEAGLGGR